MVFQLVPLLLLPVEDPPEGVDETFHVFGVNFKNAPRPGVEAAHVQGIGELHHVEVWSLLATLRPAAAAALHRQTRVSG